MKTTHVVRAVAAVLFLASFATASPRPRYESNQQGDASKTTKPPDGHRLLDLLAGSWDVAIKFKLGGQEQQGNAKCESKWVLNGMFLQQEYISSFAGAPFTVLQYLGYDNNRDKFTEIKMDSMDSAVMHNEGAARPTAKR
jgi:hypothetical protein